MKVCAGELQRVWFYLEENRVRLSKLEVARGVYLMRPRDDDGAGGEEHLRDVEGEVVVNGSVSRPWVVLLG